MNMWMMGYNDGGDLNFPPDSFSGRKLRPLIPRPLSSVTTTSTTTISPLNRIHGNDFFAQFHHMATVTDQSKRELNNNTPPVVVSSRWNPTPEQLRVLEELYRRGTRTPSAEQIQHITAQLRRYGKIEGKNVFYWFQNHKARERQKRRRQMESAVADNSSREVEILERKDSWSGRTAYEVVEQTKNWAPSTNCSTLAEESVPIQRAAKTTLMAAECRTDGWIQFDELGELHERRNNNNFAEKNNAAASLQMMHCPTAAALAGAGQLIMNTASTTTTATVTTIMHPKSHNLTAFIRPYREQTGLEEEDGEEEEEEEEEGEGEEGCGESETLQLFPLCSDARNDEIGGKDVSETVETSAMNSSNLTPLQFFEFLPLKN